MKSMKSFKRHRDYGFWDQDIRLSKLSHLGDPLEKLNKGVDFEMFRMLLEESLHQEPSGKVGCAKVLRKIHQLASFICLLKARFSVRCSFFQSVKSLKKTVSSACLQSQSVNILSSLTFVNNGRSIT